MIEKIIIITFFNILITYRIVKIFNFYKFTYYIDQIDKKKYKLFKKINFINNEKFQKAGLKHKERYFFLFLKYLLPAIVLILGCRHIIKSFFAGAFIFLTMESILQKKIKRREMVFKKNGYKIYRFLYNQISSGVRITEAIKTMYKVVDNRNLKNSLIRFSAIYSQTLEIDGALNFLKSNYSSLDVNNLAMAIRQGIKTGENLKIIKRQERLMFNKYVSYIRIKTELKKKYYLFIVLIFTLIVVLLVGFPILLNVLNATKTIFIQ